jgi:hypothetical protein
MALYINPPHYIVWRGFNKMGDKEIPLPIILLVILLLGNTGNLN